MGEPKLGSFGEEQPFCCYPAMGYWEMNGKPVSAKEAESGLAPGAIWKETEIAQNLERERRRRIT